MDDTLWTRHFLRRPNHAWDTYPGLHPVLNKPLDYQLLYFLQAYHLSNWQKLEHWKLHMDRTAKDALIILAEVNNYSRLQLTLRGTRRKS